MNLRPHEWALGEVNVPRTYVLTISAETSPALLHHDFGSRFWFFVLGGESVLPVRQFDWNSRMRIQLLIHCVH